MSGEETHGRHHFWTAKSIRCLIIWSGEPSDGTRTV